MLLLTSSASAQPLKVERIVDGDTFELRDGRRVRLIGIDTPEVHPSAKLRRDAARTARDAALIQALGKEASRHAALLALGQMVELEFDQANAANNHTDRYGRTLAYVWVLDTGMEKSFCVNARMVADGFAYAYTRYPFARMDEYRAYQREARKERRGLWNEAATGTNASQVAPADPDFRSGGLGTSRRAIPQNAASAAAVSSDKDCADFPTHSEAQRFFEQAGGPDRDAHRLDRDHDGSACEGL